LNYFHNFFSILVFIKFHNCISSRSKSEISHWDNGWVNFFFYFRLSYCFVNVITIWFYYNKIIFMFRGASFISIIFNYITIFNFFIGCC
jgi:hypothetical protein